MGVGSGRLQITFGTGTVNKVYDELIALAGINAASKAEVKEAAAQRQNVFMRAIKVLGTVVSGAFINSSLQSAYTVASEGVQTMVTVIPGVYSFEWVGYQCHVIPIVIACGILAFLEKRLHKVVPEMFDLFVTPLVSVFVTVLVTLIAVGPIFVWAENAIFGLIQALLTLPFGIGSFIVGLFYAPTVVTGIHQMYTAIDLGQLA